MSWEQVTGGISAVGGPVLGYLVYRRSKRVDAVSERAGLDDRARGALTQIISGLNELNDRLQEDNNAFREQLKYCGERLEAGIKERDELKRELARMRRKYGENGDPLPAATPSA